MSYTVTLRGGAMHNLDDDDGFDLKGQWMESRKPFPIELGDDTVLSSQIVKITRNKPTQADIPNFGKQKLIEAKSCKGRFSIQEQINGIIRDEHPRDWAKWIRNQDERERIRQELRAVPGVMYCDYKTGECFCD